MEALYETRCGYYDREEEIKNNEIFKKRFKQKIVEIKAYSEMEVWNPNTGRRYIYDEDDLYGNYYDEISNIDDGFELYYQRYMQEQQQHVLQMEQLRKQDKKYEPKSQQYIKLQKEMIRKREEVQEEMFQNVKVRTSVWKESNEKQQRGIDLNLQFQKQKQQEIEEELRLEKEIRVQEEVQQYPKRTREQVVNDRYILKQQQQKAALHQEVEAEF